MTAIVEADAVLVTINSFEGAEWRRSQLDGGVFEVHILNAGGLYSRCKAALSVVSGKLAPSHNLISFTGDEVTLTRRDKRRGHITFDGEVERKAGPGLSAAAQGDPPHRGAAPLFEPGLRPISPFSDGAEVIPSLTRSCSKAFNPDVSPMLLPSPRVLVPVAAAFAFIGLAAVHRLGPQLCLRCQASCCCCASPATRDPARAGMAARGDARPDGARQLRRPRFHDDHREPDALAVRYRRLAVALPSAWCSRRSSAPAQDR
jgi:hypothetical protein